MSRAVIYLRVSGDSQISGDGFPRQRELCLKYATEKCIEIVEEFRDEGVTGKMELEGRTGLSTCLEYIRVNGINLVIVESSDRLARDMIVAEVIIREFQKIGVRVVSASGGVNLTDGDDSNPTAKLVRQILAAVAEFDRCVIVLKLRGAKERIRKNGRAPGMKNYSENPRLNHKAEGRLPYGLKPGEERVLEEMILSSQRGLSPEKIAYSMNYLGVPTRTGKGKWYAHVIRRIIAREVKECRTEEPTSTLSA
jgi:DNA invertase Pin-like site-specific DNA recombinase